MGEKGFRRSEPANSSDVGVLCLADVRTAIIFIDNLLVI
jgi:hypothetical protein